MSVSSAAVEIVDRVVTAAYYVLETTWRKTSGTDQGTLLIKPADLVESERENLATIEAMDNGKPRVQAVDHLQEVCIALRYYDD
jgi:aldehyde dehydrogenase (NAD+)